MKAAVFEKGIGVCLPISETNLDRAAMLELFSCAWPERLHIYSEIVRCNEKKPLYRFKSRWYLEGPCIAVVRKKRIHENKNINLATPLGANWVPGVADHRAFALLHECDTQTGLRVMSMFEDDPERDLRILASTLHAAIHKLPGSPGLKAAALARRLRVRVGAAARILDARPDGRALAEAATTHFRQQAAAARDWIDGKTSVLNLDLTGEAILARLPR